MERLRSWMFVPGHIEKMVHKSFGLPVDAIMFDIEDGVLPSSKPLARETIGNALNRAVGGPTRFVRINSIRHGDAKADLEAVVRPGLRGIVVPKVETADDIRRADGLLFEIELRRALSSQVGIVAGIESAVGLLNAPAIGLASERVCGLMLGAEDLSKDIGLPIRREAEAHELLYARSALVIAATAARVQSIDQVWPDIKDFEGLRRDSLQARRLGFSGKSLIHPSQIDPINDAFSPSAEDLEFARRVLDAFKEATERGLGSVAFGGQLLDKPIVERARATLEMGEQIARSRE